MMMVAYISLITPSMLWGLSMLSLPVTAHLMHRRAQMRLVFPSIQLLARSHASQARLIRWRRWLLLLLRCLAVVCIVLAFSMPQWLDRTTMVDPTRGAGVVLLVDTSASARRLVGGVRLMDTMRVTARRVLDDLMPGVDLANIVYADARPRAALRTLGGNFDVMRNQLDDLDATFERADLTAAIALAGEQLSDHNGPRRLVVISDMQATNWLAFKNGADLAALLPDGVVVTFVPPQSDEASSTSLSKPRVVPPRPVAGRAAWLVVEAANHTDRPATVHVDINVDDVPIAFETLTLEPHQRRDVAVETVFNDVRAHRVVFRCDADDFDVDDRAFLIVHAVDRVPVIVIGDDDANEPGSASYFITRALSPRADHERSFDVRFITSAQLRAIDPEDAAAVFVSRTKVFDDAALKVIHEYLLQGGGVVFFCGQGMANVNLAAIDNLVPDGGVVPWLPVTLRDEAEGRARILHGDWGSTLLREFDEMSQMALSRIAIRRVWSGPPARSDAKIHLEFDDQGPALVSRAVGGGKLFVANFSVALDDSDLGKYGLFVALMHSLADDIQRLENVLGAGHDAVVGVPLRFGRIAVSGAIEVIGPGGRRSTAELIGRSVSPHVRLPRPTLPGFYRVVQYGEPVAWSAVNVDGRESDLRPIDPKRLAGRFADSTLVVETRGASVDDTLLSLRGYPLWGWAMVVAMTALVVELVCIGWWKR